MIFSAKRSLPKSRKPALILISHAGEVVSSASTKKSVTEVAKEVVAGKWGNGSERKEKETRSCWI